MAFLRDNPEFNLPVCYEALKCFSLLGDSLGVPNLGCPKLNSLFPYAIIKYTHCSFIFSICDVLLHSLSKMEI